MEKMRNNPETPRQTLVEKFKELYGAEMTEITYDQLPENVRTHFESQSSKFIHPEKYRVANFDKLYTFRHPNGDETYVGQQDKTYDTNEDTERLTFFVDTRNGEMTGYLELRYALNDLSDYFKGKPFEGITRTLDGFQKQGLGKRRLEVANAYSLAEHSLLLNSDSMLSEGAKKTWERLVSEGRAEKYKEKTVDRFRFIPKK